ncbi:unnamed protein product [Nesidiocoris tenuis]|uniref:Uncharacterized protein n=1 Tax=Nesidiocoris tenuis TaxID=355587 RepID=A0A6H5H9J4_9HEMI|nr:unnamed protein product [Nesidiocoris tenuis]
MTCILLEPPAAAHSEKAEPYDENDEQIYWLRPKPISPKNSPDSEVSDGANWQKKAVPKAKVTFEQNVKRLIANVAFYTVFE